MPKTSDYLFHYCGADALLEIVTSRKLWASDTRYLNDRYEGEILNNKLRDILSNPDVLLRDLSIQRRHAEALTHSLSQGKLHKVACFSKHAMSLPMFRMYAPSAGGYAIGFLTESLSRVGELHNCSYSPDELLAWCHQYVANFASEAERLDKTEFSPDDLATEIGRCTDLIGRRIVASIRFKSSDFLNEAEVRLQPFVVNDCYRSTKEGHAIIPYTPVCLPNDNMSVMLVPGPNRDPKLANETMGDVPRAARAAGTNWVFQLAYWQEHAFRV